MSNEIVWTNDQESICESVRENCLYMSRQNKKEYLKLKSSLARYRLPVIILSAMNSVWSVGVNRYWDQHLISGVSCLASLVVGIIGSVQMFYNIESKLEQTLLSQSQYYNLAISIYRELSLDRKHRDSNGVEYLNEVYQKYMTITDASLVLKNKRKFTDNLFGKPMLSQNKTLRDTIESLSDSSDDLP